MNSFDWDDDRELTNNDIKHLVLTSRVKLSSRVLGSGFCSEVLAATYVHSTMELLVLLNTLYALFRLMMVFIQD